MTPAYLISVKRTAAQTFAAFVVAQAARVGLDLPGDLVSDLAFGALFVGYYAAYRLVEQRWPEAVRLLGAGWQPEYLPTGMDRAEDDGDDAS